MITETKVQNRSTDTVPFYLDLDLPVFASYKPVQNQLIADGKLTYTNTYSTDNLTATRIKVFDSFETWSTIETLYTPENVVTYNNYLTEHAPVFGNNSLTITGINYAFTKTITYDFPAGSLTTSGVPLRQYIPSVVQTHPNLTDLQAFDAQVIVTFSYSDDTDYNSNSFNEIDIFKEIATAGATRTVHFAKV